MKPYRVLSNLVGFMLFVQVILGGSAVLFNSPDVIYHVIWGGITFVVLIVSTIYSVKALGAKSSLFRVGIAAIIDYVIQIGLGFTALALSNDGVVLVHLTNAFVLGVLVTYLISFADAADKTAALSSSTTKPM